MAQLMIRDGALHGKHCARVGERKYVTGALRGPEPYTYDQTYYV